MWGKAGLWSLLLAISAPSTTPAVAGAPQMREFDLTYSARMTALPQDARQLDIWLPYPSSDEHQEVTVTEVSSLYPYVVLREPEYGNRMLHLSIRDPRASEIVVSMTVHVRRHEYVRDLGAVPARARRGAPASTVRWLEPDRLVPLDKSIRRLAREIAGGKRSDLEKARSIYDYVVSTMSYDKSGTGWGNGDIRWACDTKRGNCTDFHALFIGLARAAGIPAKFAIGFPIPPQRGEGEVPGYHCWAEFYLAGYGWVPVDASEAWKHPEKRDYFFGAHDENRVQFTVGRDITLNPRQAGEPLNYFIYPYVEVDGQRFREVSTALRYKDQQLPTAQTATP